MGQVRLGYRPDSPERGDKPDHRMMARRAVELPRSYSLQKYVKHIFDQGDTSSCFPAGTRVALADRTERNIEEIAIGNEVLTHSGKRKRVSDVMRRLYDGKLYTIKPQGSPYTLTATDEHPILVAHNEHNKAKHGRTEPGELQWVRASEVVPGDYVLFPTELADEEPRPFPTLKVSDYVSDLWRIGDCVRIMHGRRSHVIPDEITLDDELGRLLGLFLAEGSLRRQDGMIQGITFTFARHETNYQEFVKQAMRHKFGIACKLVSSEHRRSVTDVVCPGATLGHFFLALCGEGALRKYVPPIVFRAPHSVRVSVLRGWLEGDGTQKKVKTYVYEGKEHRQSNRAVCTGVTASEELHRCLARLAFSCGLRPCMRIRKQEVHQNMPSRVLEFYSKDILKIFPEASADLDAAGITINDKLRRHREHELGFLVRVDSVKIEQPEEPVEVFNIEVEHEHTYIANGIAVHNCVGHAIAGALMVADQIAGYDGELVSPYYIYYWARALGGYADQDDGAEIRNGFRACPKFGYARQVDWPNDESKINVEPPFGVSVDAYDRRLLDSYKRLASGGEEGILEMKSAISSRRPFPFGTVVSKRLVNGIVDKVLEPPSPADEAGGHAMYAVAYDEDDNFQAVTSWGEGFPGGGFLWFSKRYMMDPRTSDKWAVIRV